MLHLLRITCRKLHLASFVANATYFSNDSSIFTFGSHVTLRSGSRPCARARDVTQVNDLGHNFNIYGDTWEFDDQTKNEQIVPSLQFKHEFVYTIRFQEMKLIVKCQEVFKEVQYYDISTNRCKLLMKSWNKYLSSEENNAMQLKKMTARILDILETVYLLQNKPNEIVKSYDKKVKK